ncbi:MAG: carbon-nitrogen hydrolase family protein, partial [Burkholderiaceae bacterium]|nr:carbon-nitrogen hydrolase family protein [Burkholderiaceae bacterium]
MSSPAPARVPPSVASAALAVAGVQMVSGIDPAANCEAAAVAIAQAAAGGARVVVLPEYFCLLGQRDTDKVGLREPEGDGPL